MRKIEFPFYVSRRQGSLETMTTSSASSKPNSPLGYREYRELWTANAGSNFGSQVQVVGAGWLMTSLTTSPQTIALVQTATNFATVCFILIGGALADNYDRRRIMLVAQTCMLLTALLLAGLTWWELVTPWSLLALTFLISGLGSLNNPAWQASIRDILPREMISRAVALNSTSINLARAAGPALGGLIVATAGVAAAFVANAVSFVGFLAALARWRARTAQPLTQPESMLSAMAVGIRYAVHAPNVRNAVVRGGLSGLSASAVFTLMPVVARQEMGGNAAIYGLLLAAFGAGAVASAMLGANLRASFAPDNVVRIAAATATIGLAILAMAPNPWVAGVDAALSGSGWTLTHTTFNTTVQLSAPRWVTARALALYQTATFAGMAIGSVVLGWVAEQQDVQSALWVASFCQLLAGLVSFVLPLIHYEHLQVEPLESARTPDLEEPVNPDEGPIQVELMYLISGENRDAFLTAMAERGRIRRRDGAKDWSIWQDLANRRLWIESYRVANWAEYLRHISRRTQADLGNFEALASLNEDPKGPAIRRYAKRV